MQIVYVISGLMVGAGMIGIGIIVGRVGRVPIRTQTLRLLAQIVCDPKNQPHQWVGKPRSLWQTLTGRKAKRSFLHSPEDYCSLLAPSETRRRLLAMYERRDDLERRMEKEWSGHDLDASDMVRAYGDDLIELERAIGVFEDKLVAIKTRSL